MSPFHDSHDGPSELQRVVLDHLRGRRNPFENLVQAQIPDDQFEELHVDGLLRAPRELLHQIIDRYRTGPRLHPTRIVTIRGPRGGGKTHILESLAHHRDRARFHVLVRPAFYDAESPFQQYLLAQISNALNSHTSQIDVPFHNLARHVTRSLLIHALRSLNPVESLLTCHQRRIYPWTPAVWRGGDSRRKPIKQLLEELKHPGSPDILLSLIKQFNLPAFVLARIIEKSMAPVENILEETRRRLEMAMVHTVLLQQGDAFNEYLESEMSPVDDQPLRNDEVVRGQIRCIVDACFHVKWPIVVAFDNLEGLLAPRGTFTPGAARSLMSGLAQTADSTQGLLFLLFAEDDLFSEVRKNIDSFIEGRLAQGVHLHGLGPVDEVELKPPPWQEVQAFIRARIEPIYAGIASADQLPSCFPIGTEFLEDLQGRVGLALRGKLLRLRDEYSRVVYGRKPPAEPAIELDGEVETETPPTQLEHLWQEARQKASEGLQTKTMALLVQEAHLGLREILRQAPAHASCLRVDKVTPTSTADGHTVYSKVTVIDWHSSRDQRPFRVSVGLLLAEKRAMPRDLRAKLSPLPDGENQAGHTVVLWHRPASIDGDAVATLPPATRTVWDEGTRARAAVLKPITSETVCRLLAIPQWCAQAAENHASAEQITQFIEQNCGYIVKLAIPAMEEC